jgi:exosortase
LKAWDKEPDYSHGYLVLPLALYALWTRKDTMPEITSNLHWAGLGLIGASCLMRWIGARFFLGAIDGWSILLWVAGAVWLLGGWRLLKWALPGVVFLWFMIPMPHQLEHMFRDPLQRVATKASTVALQCLGQPALAEGNIVRMGEEELLIADACSGLRICVAIAGLACAYSMIVRPVWWERVVLVVAVLPIAIISNVARIVITGLIYQVTTNHDMRERWHDYAGFFMIPFAAALFAFLLWYLSKLIREVEPDAMTAGYRHRTAT